jgi:hypothetical protein
VPSQATNYFYTLAAMGVIALVVTSTFNINVYGVKSAAERKQLLKVLDAVAAECTELTVLTEKTGASAEVTLKLPTRIGDKLYWVRLRTSDSGSWIEGGFGEPWNGIPELRVYLPWNTTSSGTYRGEYGTPSVNCTMSGGTPTLTLKRLEDN